MSQLDWNATIDTIRESVPQAQFQNWFKPLRLIRCDDKSVVLGVPNRFHEEWLKTNYSDKLSQAIRQQLGTERQLEFEIVLKEENQAASLSDPSSLNTPPPQMGQAQTQRPVLRVVESSEVVPMGELASAQPAAPTAPVADPSPQLPVFNDPFIEMDFNTVAVQCAKMFATGRELPLNPLVFVSGVGMGKTHLISEMGQQMHNFDKKLRIRYTDAESFTAEMVRAIKSNTIYLFKQKYGEDTDVLLFDDVHGLSKRLKTQEELLHIFNQIVARGGRICFTSSVPPHLLENFIEPMKSRILSGVISELQYPSYESRVELLNRKCALDKLIMAPEILRSLADKGQKDIRELLGSLIRLHLHARLENRPVDHEFLAKKGWVQETKKHATTMEEIVSLVEHNFGIGREELISKSRKSVVAWARQVAMYLARHHTLLSLEEIGKRFGRDHATVIHAFGKVKETIASHPNRRYEIEYLEAKLSSQGHRPVN